MIPPEISRIIGKFTSELNKYDRENDILNRSHIGGFIQDIHWELDSRNYYSDQDVDEAEQYLYEQFMNHPEHELVMTIMERLKNRRGIPVEERKIFHLDD